jgi:hypothetical protein
MQTTHIARVARRIAVGLVVVAGLSYGGVALASSEPATPKPAPEATSLSPQLSQHFAALRTGSVVSAAEVAKLNESEIAIGEDQQFGLNTSLAVSVGSPEGHPIWLIPGSNGLCIYRSGEGACTSIENALAGHLVMALGGSATQGPTLYGVVPDGNPIVSLYSASGASQPISVTSNVYVAQNSDAKTISLVSATGKQESIEAP